MRIVDYMDFYSNFINKLHILPKPFYAPLHDDISIERTPELDKLCNEIKKPLSQKIFPFKKESTKTISSQNEFVLIGSTDLITVFTDHIFSFHS